MKKSIIILASIALSGCDYLYIISRDADSIEYTKSSCIERTLREVNGLSGIHANTMQKQPNPALNRHAASTNHYYQYVFEKRAALIQITQYDTGTSSYSHGYHSFGPYIPQRTFATLLPKMRTIDEAIATNCNIFNLNEIKEKCSGVDLCENPTN